LDVIKIGWDARSRFVKERHTVKKIFTMKNFKLLFLLVASLGLTSACTNYYYIVRHAEKSDTPPSDPNLSDAGRRRALALCDSLRNKNVSKIFVSQFVRTQQTAQPAAGLLGITPTPYDAQANVSLLADQMRASGDVNLLVVGHSNTVPALILNLTGENVGSIPENDYDNFFVIKRVRNNNNVTFTLVRRGTYGASSP
jgi:Phosphohistidine phosphatase SixA